MPTLQYSWASLVAQLVKNLPAMWEDLGLIPGLGRSLEKEGKGDPLQYSGWENSLGSQRIGHDLVTKAPQKQEMRVGTGERGLQF